MADAPPAAPGKSQPSTPPGDTVTPDTALETRQPGALSGVAVLSAAKPPSCRTGRRQPDSDSSRMRETPTKMLFSCCQHICPAGLCSTHWDSALGGVELPLANENQPCPPHTPRGAPSPAMCFQVAEETTEAGVGHGREWGAARSRCELAFAAIPAAPGRAGQRPSPPHHGKRAFRVPRRLPWWAWRTWAGTSGTLGGHLAVTLGRRGQGPGTHVRLGVQAPGHPARRAFPALTSLQQRVCSWGRAAVTTV